MRRVEHRLSPCLDTSGTTSADAFAPAAPLEAGSSCVKQAQSPGVTFAAGDRDGRGVATILSYALGDVPRGSVLVGANLVFSFEAPIGMPYELYDELWLEQLDAFTTDPAFLFGGEPVAEVGLLASRQFTDPVRPQKDTTAAVSGVLEGNDPAALLVFRARFRGVIRDDNGSPDYVRLGSTEANLPALILTYECAACPEAASAAY
jgi:hypothetical protein